MEKLNALDIKKVFEKIKETMDKNKEWLFELDSAVGDGDLGMSMSNGFKKVYEGIKDLTEEKVGNIFMKAGYILAEEAPSTAGTLIGTSLMEISNSLIDKIEINLSDFSKIICTFSENIMKTGNCKPGEKTILDSIYPASKALSEAVKNNLTLKDGLRGAYIAAQKGFESTKDMIPRHGRGSWYREKALGKLDPGAAAGMLIIKAFHKFVSNK